MNETNKQKAFILAGLGIGEETKGAAVQWLCEILKANRVLRSGGSQAGHHIITEDGREQMFSHFGCGTFNGVPTHLKHMVINPADLFTEALELEEKGVANPFDMITISDDCLTVTPFHGAMSRLKEVLRENKKGTIGKGVGDAVTESKNHPELSIYARDFKFPISKIEEKVEAIRQQKIKEANALIQTLGIEELSDEAFAEMKILHNSSLVSTIAESFSILSELVRIVDQDYLADILENDQTIVGEPSHGALLHPWYGFIPHTTQIDPTAQDVLNTLQECTYPGRVIRLGVSRCYMTRHGAGPLVSFNRELTDQIEETHNNAGNDWLGEFRNGNYDVVAMKYALAVSGGINSFDGLVISYLDILEKFNEWQICVGYKCDSSENLEDFFEISDGVITGIKVHPNTQDEKHYSHQVRLTELLKQCVPVLTTIKATDEKTLEEVYLDFVEENLKVPVVALARGPKSTDREIRKGWEYLFYPTEA